MSVVRKLPTSPAEHYDALVEEAIVALRRVASYSVNCITDYASEARCMRAYELGPELNKLRRPEIVERLEAERLAKARALA